MTQPILKNKKLSKSIVNVLNKIKKSDRKKGGSSTLDDDISNIIDIILGITNTKSKVARNPSREKPVSTTIETQTDNPPPATASVPIETQTDNPPPAPVSVPKKTSRISNFIKDISSTFRSPKITEPDEDGKKHCPPAKENSNKKKNYPIAYNGSNCIIDDGNEGELKSSNP
jgi:hypothetical protein